MRTTVNIHLHANSIFSCSVSKVLGDYEARNSTTFVFRTYLLEVLSQFEICPKSHKSITRYILSCLGSSINS